MVWRMRGAIGKLRRLRVPLPPGQEPAESATVCRPHPTQCVRLVFVGDQPAFIMLSAAKHLANEWNLRSFSYAGQILR